MPKVWYKDHKFNAVGAQIVATANDICDEYMAQGFTLTLRQLYYQFVARGLIANKQTEYDRLGSIINHARLAGMIDWEAIEDRTRNLERLGTWDSPADILTAIAQQFRFDPWDTQDHRIEVWIEKEALAGVIEPICNKYRVPFFACRGYVSQSESWRAARRLGEYIENGQACTIFHLGDHDPSGIDMSRDNKDRLTNFIGADLADAMGEDATDRIELIRLALNIDQVKKYKPPPNPAKFTDSRAEGYVAKFGTSSWELDALEPKMIANLIETNILMGLDDDKWSEAMQREQRAKDYLRELGDGAAAWEDKE